MKILSFDNYQEVIFEVKIDDVRKNICNRTFYIQTF